LCSAFLNSGVRSLLDADALKALIVVQHQSRISIQDPLIATPEQLRSRIKIADRQAAAHGTWALVRAVGAANPSARVPAETVAIDLGEEKTRNVPAISAPRQVLSF